MGCVKWVLGVLGVDPAAVPEVGAGALAGVEGHYCTTSSLALMCHIFSSSFFKFYLEIL